MLKFLLALVVGIAIGYYVGYGDGKSGTPSIVERLTGKVGGKSRDRVGNDIDAKMKAVEEGTKTRPPGR